MQDMADLLDKISDNIAGAYAEKAGGDVAEWRQVMVKETWYTPRKPSRPGSPTRCCPRVSSRPAREAEPEMRTFDLTAYGYHRPEPAGGAEAQPAAPHRACGESADAHDQPSWISSTRTPCSRLRAAAAPEPAPVIEPEAPAAPEPVAPVPSPSSPGRPEPVDEWAGAFAHLLVRARPVDGSVRPPDQPRSVVQRGDGSLKEAPVATPTIPRDADELAEALGDTATLKAIAKDKDTLEGFILDYAKGQQKHNPDIEAQIREETQRQFADILRDDKLLNGINRLNLDPTAPPVARSKHYNAKAPGAALDKQFTGTGATTSRRRGRARTRRSRCRPLGHQEDPERVRVDGAPPTAAS
jgi:hypothetical protein